MVAWNHQEKPDPMDIYTRRTEKARLNAMSDAIETQAYADWKARKHPEWAAATCETCGVSMSPDEVAYSGPRYCVDCACDEAERLRHPGWPDCQCSDCLDAYAEQVRAEAWADTPDERERSK